MDIAFIARRFDTVGGTERDLYHLTRLFDQFGHQVTVYCQQVRIAPPGGVVIKKVPSLGIGRTAKLWALACLGPKAAYDGGHDLVVGFTRVLRQDIVRCGGGTHKIFLERMMASEGPLKRILRKLSPYHNSLLRIEKRQLQQGNRKVLAISEVVKREIVETYSIPENFIEIIYDGIDTSIFNPENKEIFRKEIRKAFGIPEGSHLLLFLGNGFRRKGLDLLLKSLSLLDEEVYCLVVGGDARLDNYKEKTMTLGISNRVMFAGVQKDAEKFFGASDIYVLPSLQEAFGNTVLEAMACGLPVITTRVAGASEVLADGLEEFILEDPHDAKELSGLIQKLLDPEIRLRLGKKSSEIAGAYTLEANSRAIETLCEQVLEEKRRCQNI